MDLHHTRSRWSEAKEMCRACPVLLECAEYALGVEVDPEDQTMYAGARPVQIRRAQAAGRTPRQLIRLAFPAV
jgi:hypothetical protein